MRFRNTKTGAIIEVSSEIKGPWEPVGGSVKATSTDSKPSTETKPARRTKKKEE